MRRNNPHYFSIYLEPIKLLALLIFGFFLLACHKKENKQILIVENKVSSLKGALDVNSASADELEKLPGVGRRTAEKIVAHRERYGRFRRPEHLILVPGISDKRFREMKGLIRAE